jgi:hypothetical protein
LWKQRLPREVLNLDRVKPSLPAEMQSTQVGSQSITIQRRGHHEETAPALQRDRKDQVNIQATLMKLIQDQSIKLSVTSFPEHAEHDTRGCKDDAGGGGDATVAPDDVSNLRTQRDLFQVRHPSCQSSTSHPARLDDQHPTR